MEIVCQGCYFNVRDLTLLCKDKSKFINFLYEHNLIKKWVKCPICKTEITINEQFHFRCDKTVITRGNKKVSKFRCRFKKSAFVGTFFWNAHLSPETVLWVVYWFVCNKLAYSEICEQVEVSARTLVDWFSFSREVIIHYFEKSSEKIGGPGKTVEIDEAKFGKRKYNQRRIIEGMWVFAGFEHESKKTFMVPVADRTGETLIRVIKEWVWPGTNIISDCWASYAKLSVEGYGHTTVKHSQNFINPKAGASTQTCLRQWGDARNQIPKCGKKDQFDGYLAMGLFVEKFPSWKERFHKFLLAAADLLPPQKNPTINQHKLPARVKAVLNRHLSMTEQNKEISPALSETI